MVKKIGKYELGKTLGSGTFGKVKYAIDTEDPQKKAYAIKVLVRAQIEKENMQEQLKNEIAIMKMLKHKHVVKMYEVIQSPQHIYIVLELVTGGELFDRIVAAKRFDENTARRYFQQLIFGVHFCHIQGVAHRDLKPENLLLDGNDLLKISDFGLSAMSGKEGAQKSKLLMTTCGTPNYVAPEVLKEKGYDGFITDIWSCGVILFVMLAGYLPFDDPTMNGLFIKIERGEYRMPKSFSEPVKKLITKMLTVDPAKRISMEAIVQDPWFSQGLDANAIKEAMSGGKSAGPTDGAIAGAITDAADAQTVARKGADAKADYNAFELASHLIMGALTPMTSNKDGVNIRRNTQFLANGGVDELITRVEAELKKLGVTVNERKDPTKKVVKGYFNQAKGALLTYQVSFVGTVCKDLSMVEVARLRGDILEFQQFYRKLVGALKDVVPTQPPPAAEEEPE